MKYVAYCDGAYSSARHASGSGVVILKDGVEVLRFGRKFNGGTNNTAELCAVILAMCSIKAPIDEIEIISDSMYIIGTVNNGWKRNKNKRLWSEFDRCFDRLSKLCPKIHFTWVKGHSCNVFNNMADEIAVRHSQMI